MKFAVLTIMFCFLSVVQAEESKQGEHKGACKTEIQKFCKDVTPGEGRIIQCMKSHEAELSTECKEQMAKMKGPGGDHKGEQHQK